MATKFHEMTEEELNTEFVDLNAKLYTLRNQMKIEKKVDNPVIFRNLRKDIARILTVKREMELK